MMRNPFHFIRRDLICDDGQSLVQLHGIPIDDLAIKSTSYLHSQLPEVIRTAQRAARKFPLTSDFPVPVAPTMATRGLDGGVTAILAAVQYLSERIMRSSKQFPRSWNLQTVEFSTQNSHHDTKAGRIPCICTPNRGAQARSAEARTPKNFGKHHRNLPELDQRIFHLDDRHEPRRTTPESHYLIP